jgi:DNA (cytosine-5)-methyltransferase 1
VKPNALIVYSGQAGEAAGYVRAGFNVLCTDLYEQPRCPFPFVRMSALDAIEKYWRWAQLLAGGPVCKAYSKTARIHNAGHPTQIPETRKAMVATGKPYVIENVEDALPELIDPVMLCGQSFGLRTYRHRLFESNVTLTQPRPTEPPRDPEPCGFDHLHKVAKMGRPIPDGEFYHAVGHFSGVELVRKDMGVPWMSREGINQCIPPAYSEYIGHQVMAHLGEVAA